MDTYSNKKSSLAIFIAVLWFVVSLIKDFLPFAPYIKEEKRDVWIQPYLDFYHRHGIVVVKITQPRKSIEVLLKGFNCEIDTAFAFNAYGKSIPLDLHDNIIKIHEDVSEDSLAIHYIFQNITKVDNIIVRDTQESWNFLTQKEKKTK